MNKYILIICILAMSSFDVFANRQTGIITGILPLASGDRQIIIFKLEGNYGGGCNITKRYAFDSTSGIFDFQKAALLSAFHSKTPVLVDYTADSCTYWGNAEDVNRICFGSINC